MALKETLVRLKRQQDAPASLEAGRLDLRDEWIDAVGALIDDFRTFLRPFEADGGLVVREREVALSEDALGTYSVRAATIEAGPATIDLTPVARLVVGAVGRIDLSRKGYPKSSNRILLLRRLDDDDAHRWFLRMPTEVARIEEFGGSTRQFDFKYLPFDRDNVEKAIEFLLNL